jgi:hypothetical protein
MRPDEDYRSGSVQSSIQSDRSSVVLKTEGVIANRFFNVQPISVNLTDQLPSCQHSEAIDPGTENNQKVVEGAHTHGAMPSSGVEIEATNNDNRFEKRDDDSPVKMLKQEPEQNVALYLSSERVDSRQGKRPVRKLEKNEKDQVEPIPTEFAHSTFLL